MEIRRVVKKDGKEKRRDAIVGTIWLSGWDERLADTVDKLSDGEYIIEFEPDGIDGSDGILWTKVYKLVE